MGSCGGRAAICPALTSFEHSERPLHKQSWELDLNILISEDPLTYTSEIYL